MTENVMTKYERHFMGQIPQSMCRLNHSFDGRFLIGFESSAIIIADLFHSKRRDLFLDISAASNEGSPLKTHKRYQIESVFASDLSTMLVLFKFCDSYTLYLGVGEINLEDSLVIVRKTTSVPVDYEYYFDGWFPLSRPQNLSELALRIRAMSPQYQFFTIKMEGEDQLQLSPLPLDVPVGVKVFGFFDGFLYGLAYQNRSKTDSGRPIDLVKISLSNGQHVREPTKNYEIVKHICIRSTRFHVLCWKTIVCDYPSPIRSKDEISSLDLETLEWKRTNIEFDSICSIGGDGSQPLMVATLGNDPSKYNVYRVNFNQPEKLSDLVWLRLKRIFDARLSAYKSIIGRLPTNFKQKCPFPQSGTYKITGELIETEQQIRERFAALSQKTTISFELKKRSKVLK